MADKPKAIKVYLIDPYKRTVTEHLYDASLESIYQAIGNGCSCFQDIAIDFTHHLFVDEEANMKDLGIESDCCFKIQGKPHVFRGRGLIIGINRNGNDCDPTLSRQFVEGQVIWPFVKLSGNGSPDQETYEFPEWKENSDA